MDIQDKALHGTCMTYTEMLLSSDDILEQEMLATGLNGMFGKSTATAVRYNQP
jgi:hypothetical protein